MFKKIKEHIAIKLAIIITTVIIASFTVVFLYLNTMNFNQLNKTLKSNINNSINLLSKMYKNPLWASNYKDVGIISSSLLDNPYFVAINVYNNRKLVVGYKKKYPWSNLKEYTKEKILKPYKLHKNCLLRKKNGKIMFNTHDIGRFEVFYTEKHIKDTNKVTIIYMGSLILILALVIITFILLLMKKVVINPVVNISNKTNQVAENKDYSLLVIKSKKDEISSLYHDFNHLLKQIKKKDANMEKVLLSLRKKGKSYNYMFYKLKNAIEHGDYSKVKAVDNDENGLIKSLNIFLETLELYDLESKEKDWLTTGQTIINDAVSGEIKLEKLSQNAITNIAEYINAQIGAIYIKNENDEFNFYAGYALEEKQKVLHNFKFQEGLAGQVAFSKKIMLITDIPDSYLKVNLNSKAVIAKNILLLPLIYEQEVKGVIELFAINQFTPSIIEFLKLATNSIAVAVNTAIVSEKFNQLLIHTTEQTKELQVSQEKTKNTNLELEKQTKFLIKSQQRLQTQKEELQSTNEEMEEKNELLENRRTEIKQKNTDLKKIKIKIEEKAAQLKDTTKYRAEFFANMSHELRTPLNNMLILAKMLSENKENNLLKDQIESVVSINKSGQGLLHLINDILDLSKLEAKKVELNITTFNIAEFLSNLEKTFKHLSIEKKIKFDISVEEGLIETITTDVIKLDQILKNILDNAFKFTDEGSILVKVHKPETDIKFNNKDLQWINTIAISVEDTGPGIPADKIQPIFEAFIQVDGSISRQHGGTGLGLSISRELVSLLKGELKVKSTLRKGTIFTIYIPEILLKTVSKNKITDLFFKRKIAKLRKREKNV